MDGKEMSALKMIKAVPEAQHHPKTETPLHPEAGERLSEATPINALCSTCRTNIMGVAHFNLMERYMLKRLHNSARSKPVRRNEVRKTYRPDPVLDVDALLRPQYLHPPGS